MATRIALVGAGFIARSHAEALAALPGRTITAIVDPNEAAARRLAEAVAPEAAIHADVAAAIAARGFDRAHVLVPPDRHRAVAEALLAAGIPVLAEKPLATSSADAEALVRAAAEARTFLGVNQNFVHHPAFARLRAAVEGGRLGPPRHLSSLFRVPLRQLAARQFSHWMFERPENILLEQSVHPLSQILALAGTPNAIAALAGRLEPIAPGAALLRDFTASFAGGRLPVQFAQEVGAAYPVWRVTVACDDGVAVADMFANRFVLQGRGGLMEPVDVALTGLAGAAATARDAAANLAGYALSTARLVSRRDPFFISMRDTIAAFHEAVDAGRAPALDGAFGAGLVRLCEGLAAQLLPAAVPTAPRPEPAPRAAEPSEASPGTAILGGTGFIGQATVRRFLDAGHRVTVMARSVRNLPELFADPRVTLRRGDIGDAAAVARAIEGASLVVNLAHGGGGGDFEAVRQAMVGGAETVARACLAADVRRLVHVGSIASLYLGDARATVTGTTPPDPQEGKRGDYARAKVLADRALLQLHAESGLPVVILRPGVVVGAGASPFHSGLGLFNNDQHCIGWNAGRNPLPFVLVEDVADAILRAAETPGIEGRCYNLVGDVRLSAREYIDALARRLRRPLRFHAQSPVRLWLEDVGKWTIKRASGRAVPAPDLRDFRSRGMVARFDTTDAQRDLGWTPVADRARFLRDAIEVHG